VTGLRDLVSANDPIQKGNLRNSQIPVGSFIQAVWFEFWTQACFVSGVDTFKQYLLYKRQFLCAVSCPLAHLLISATCVSKNSFVRQSYWEGGRL
jgi:hypothetical protein